MRPHLCLLAATLLIGCQTADEALTTASAPTAISGPAASAIAGDMASRLAEQMGSASSAAIKMDKGTSDFAMALETALKGWGYSVVTDGGPDKDAKPVELAYSLDTIDGHVLAQLSTPSLALGRAYTATPSGATPVSPLSIMQRN
ncbi:conjugal transfer protein TrbH [Pseudaminobacter soli (ex Li et al. 2025)]|uniref:Conjugal transfer protein TrbH n=1 Tax=Pseudaminobacter soli (ex Li et al. 2025) TaxID=1295366 RepID=A0A2P7RM95_9HYPH|nr:conjugal transfer protein TrbH [Mesorhizobium soli]PSJ51344.1 conjugal transfer protein TrbH [Mesorhizobium soli]